MYFLIFFFSIKDDHLTAARSCYREHMRYSLCHSHYAEGHNENSDVSYEKCDKCKKMFRDEDYKVFLKKSELKYAPYKCNVYVNRASVYRKHPERP